MRSMKFTKKEAAYPPEQLSQPSRLVAWHHQRLQQYNQLYTKANCPGASCYPKFGIGDHCEIILSRDDEVSIESLLLKNTTIHNKFFLGRTLTSSLNVGNIISTIVENTEGTHAIRLYNLFHFTYPMFIPPGSIIIITNPRVQQKFDGDYLLRCNNTMDFHFIDENACCRIFPSLRWKGEIPKPFKSLKLKQISTRLSTLNYTLCNRTDRNYLQREGNKEKGNECFMKKQYMEALTYYHRAHKLFRNDTEALSSRAAVMLKFGWYTSALEDINHVLKLEPLHVKAICSKSKAMAERQNFCQALAFLKKTMGDFEAGSEGRQILTVEVVKLEKMMAEYENGVYDFTYLMEHRLERLEDCAEYCAPIELTQVPGKGRGIISKATIKAGNLVLAIRAYDIIGQSSIINYMESPPALNVEERNRDLLTTIIIRHLIAEPDSQPKFFFLFAGPSMGYESGNRTNWDPQRLRNIVDYNSFSKKYELPAEGTSDDEHTIGLWIIPSFINHSCVDSNCCWKIYGDFLFIRAHRDIEKREEILMPYFNPLINYMDRKALLEKVGISCDCRLCQIEKTETEEDHAKRREITEKCNSQGDINIKMLHGDLESLKKLREDQKYNLNMMNLHRELSRLYLSIEKPGKAVEQLKLAHSFVTGTALTDLATEFAAKIMLLLLENKNKMRAKQWAAQLKKDLIHCYGTVDAIKILNEKYGESYIAMQRHGINLK